MVDGQNPQAVEMVEAVKLNNVMSHVSMSY